MKNLIYFLLLFTIFSSCCHSRVVITDEDLPEEVFYRSDRVKPYSGECVIYYSDTKIIKEEMTFRNGILHGPMTSYYMNGTIRRQGAFFNGKMEGKWESWYRDGKKQYTVNYSCDSLNGEYFEWYSTGVMKEKGIYAQNKPVGNWIAYDEAGMIIRNENLKNK